MKAKTILLLSALSLIITGCSDSQTQEATKIKEIKNTTAQKQETQIAQEVSDVKKVYMIAEIYNSMCVECHSSDGSGNTEKLTPSMATLSQKEMQDALLEIENDDGHIIMQHNREQILKMGMQYKAEEMAQYMFTRFNQ